MSASPVASDPEGLGASRVLLSERGYLYDASYLVRMAISEEPLFFKNDAEWLDYMTVGGYEEEDEDD